MDKGSGAVRRVPFWRSLQTKFALTYIVIVAAVLILLNTYPLVVSEKLAYQSKQASMLNQASVLASALATGPEALTAEGATRTVELLRGSLGVTRVVVTDPNGLVLCDFQDGVGRTDTAGGTPCSGSWSPPCGATTCSAPSTATGPSEAGRRCPSPTAP